MVSAHAYPTFELSDAVLLLVKAAARERKLGPCPEIPYCPEIPSLTLPEQELELLSGEKLSALAGAEEHNFCLLCIRKKILKLWLQDTHGKIGEWPLFVH